MKICEYLNNYVIIRLLEIMNTTRASIVIEGLEKNKNILPIYSILIDSTAQGNIIIYIYNRMKLRNIKVPYLLIYTTAHITYIPSTSKNVELVTLWLAIEKAENTPKYISIISGG
jgi:hypothetical protein